MITKFKTGFFMLQTFVMFHVFQIIAWAANESTAESDDLIDFIKEGPESGKNPFEKATEMVKNTGASFYQLAMAFTVVVMIVCFIAAGLRYSWCKGQKREDSKDSLLAAFVGGAIAFAACSLVLLVKNIAGGLF